MNKSEIIRVMFFWVFILLVVMNVKTINRVNPLVDGAIKNKKLRLFILFIGTLACIIQIIGALLRLTGRTTYF